MHVALAILFLNALAPQVVLRAGPLELEVHTGSDAQLFHVVDQLSDWSLYCHQQYRRVLGPFSPDEEALLQKHAAIRKARGYGVLDQTFYPADDWRRALDQAVAAGELTRAEGDTERAVLSHFAPRLRPFLDRARPQVAAAVEVLRQRVPELEAFARRAARFTESSAVRLPLYLVPSGVHGAGGGGANGGVLVVEVGEGADHFYTLVHESWHAFVERRGAALDEAAAHTTGLDRTLLSEGLAHAIYPGLIHPGSGDPLAAKVRDDLAARATDERARRFALFDRYALALRPLVAEALDDRGQTLVRFLPRACDVFRALASLNGAIDAPAPLHGVFVFGPTIKAGSGRSVFGPATDFVLERARALGTSVWGRPHGAGGYAVLADAQPGDVVVLLVTRAELKMIAADTWRDLWPIPAELIATVLDSGRPIEEEATRRQWRVLLLAAPDDAQLKTLVAHSASLARLLPAPGANKPPAR